MREDTTGLEGKLSQIREWLEECCTNHICHRGRDSGFLPSRLIDVGGQEESVASLVLSAEVPSSSPYLTLSHCWGQLQPLKLTTSNLQSMLTGISFEKLTKTFQQAVMLAKALGFRYIWIDSLCIIQDSDEDWQKESSEMGFIYTNALFNIAATSATDGSGGLLRNSNRFTAASAVAVLPAIDKEPRLFQNHYVAGKLDSYPLNSRGWVVQERILSRGNLHFTDVQLYWECSEGLFCETIPNNKLRAHSGVPEVKYEISRVRLAKAGEPSEPTSATPVSRPEIWAKIYSLYSGCQLTRPVDMLIAIGGLASIAAEVGGGTYLAGLWLEEFLTELCWHSYDMPNNCGGNVYVWASSNAFEILNSYIAPSWSWASSTCKVVSLFSARKGLDFRNHARILEVPTVITVSNNPYGQLRDAWVKLAGRLALGHWQRRGGKVTLVSSQDELTECFFSFSLSRIGPHSYGRDMISQRRIDTESLDMVFCLPLVSYTKSEELHSFGIILRQVHGITSKFTRCGSFEHVGVVNSTPKSSMSYDYFDTISKFLGFESISDDKGGKIYPVTII
jgi:hypothetical protein